jgi:hypothetical protein
MQVRAFQATRAYEKIGRVLGFFAPSASGAEDNPVKHGSGVFFGEPQDCASASDFDVIGMTSKAQDI